MKKWAAYLASLLSFLGALGHMINGGKSIADPLLTNDSLSIHDRSMLWMVWHVVSVAFIGMSLLYAYGGYSLVKQYIESALVFTILFGMVGLITPLYLGVGLNVLPNGIAFIPIGILGYISIHSNNSLKTNQ